MKFNNPRTINVGDFFVFHVKNLHKNFFSREKVIIFAAFGKGLVGKTRVLT